jgi:hypothetical protein
MSQARLNTTSSPITPAPQRARAQPDADVDLRLSDRLAGVSALRSRAISAAYTVAVGLVRPRAAGVAPAERL